MVHYKLDIKPGVYVEIHQHYHNRSILTGFVKGRSLSICYKWHYYFCSFLLITIQHSLCIKHFLGKPSLGQCDLS